MNRRLRWRLVATVVVTFGISLFAWYPVLADRYGLAIPDFLLEKRPRLGLDLKGGVQMVLRVNTDDAVLVETRNTARRLDEALTREGVKRGPIEVLGAGRFRVADIRPEDDHTLRRVSAEIASEFDRESGVGGVYTFTIARGALAGMRTETVRQARQTVDRRVNALGVAEPMIAIQGASGDEIVVQLPGVADMDRARGILGATALLEWKLVERGPAPTRDALLAQTGASVPADTEVAIGMPNPATGDPSDYYLVRNVAAISGRDLRNARPMSTENNQPAVAFSLTADGARRFAQLTGDNVGRHLAIILDGRVQSAPQIQERIDGGEGHIRGQFTLQQAADLSLVLRAGALPASMTYLGGRFVGPSLGSASVHAGVVASVSGLVLIAAFMLVYYNRAGLNAIVSVVVNLLLLLGLMAYSGAALTLPGIAGLILTIGMGVDSNVLIFERIKEELAAGKSAQGRGRRGLRPGVPDDSRYAHRVPDCRRVPVPVRHRTDSRLRHDAHVRTAVQRLHGGVRLAHDLRSRSFARTHGTAAHRNVLAALSYPESGFSPLALARAGAVVRCDSGGCFSGAEERRRSAGSRLLRRNARHGEIRRTRV